MRRESLAMCCPTVYEIARCAANLVRISVCRPFVLVVSLGRRDRASRVSIGQENVCGNLLDVYTHVGVSLLAEVSLLYRKLFLRAGKDRSDLLLYPHAIIHQRPQLEDEMRLKR